MATPLIPQEIFLLERYSSADYFGDMRDAWSAMVKHAEKALDIFERNLPADYRKRPLPEQPDIVWGERVLVNFCDTRDYLDSAFIRMTHNDFTALSAANGVLSDFAGFSRDYSADWMDEPAVAAVMPAAADKFWRLLGEATERASNIQPTFYAQWNTGELTSRYNHNRGPLNPPASWPLYRLNSTVVVATGQPVPRTGIYLPAADDSAAAFMIEGRNAPQATVGYDPVTTQNVSEQPTTWTLVERIADAGGGTPSAGDPSDAGLHLRCEGGHPCPQEGWWFTPAKLNSRRHFNHGEVMPVFTSDYGSTIWQWDERQG
jgi:hypothetical protein